MDTKQQTIARQCLESAENNTMIFPRIVGTLMAAGFEGYLADLRLGQATYYLPNGEGLELPTHRSTIDIGAEFNTGIVRAAIREAQTLTPGYTCFGKCSTCVSAVRPK
jgi:hypothetical protein